MFNLEDDIKKFKENNDNKCKIIIGKKTIENMRYTNKPESGIQFPATMINQLDTERDGIYGGFDGIPIYIGDFDYGYKIESE